MRRLSIFTLVAIALFVCLSLIETLRSTDPFTWMGLALDLFETALLALAVVSTAYVSLETRDMRRERADLLNDLARARDDGDRWRAAARSHIDGLGRAIAEQFAKWGLSQGEADVAALMLKGLSHKEIAGLRSSGEATVRQQAAAVYRKSGLASRAELSAFFLEDLFTPAADRAAPCGKRLALVEPDGSALDPPAR